MIYISPSLLAADFADLGNEIEKIEAAGADYLHLDVMDGMFVPNMSFGECVISSIRRRSNLLFDVHLMIKDPERYIDRFIKAGADMISVHYESCDDPESALRHIKMHEMKAAIAISPKTPAEVVFPLIDKKLVDMVLVMTVEPGFGGQSLIPETLMKVREIKKYALEHCVGIDIEVDGGINAENVGLVTAAGANVIVAGSAIFKSKKPKQVIAQMRKSADEHPFIN